MGLKSITVHVSYDSAIQKITRVASEEIVVSENCVFIFLLQSIFTSHSGIPARYPAGTIGLLLNDKIPRELDILEDGDELVLTASQLNSRIVL